MNAPELIVKFTGTFQNIDGDGLPTQGGDIVGTVESPKDKAALIKRVKSFSRVKATAWRAYFPDENYRMALCWLTGVLQNVDVERIVPVHAAGRKPPTPRRDLLVTAGEIAGWPATVILGHAVNSAWAPKWKPTTWRARRRSLWWAWWNTLLPVLDRHHTAGRVVILMVDGNRSGAWCPPGMVEVASHGPDRVFITKNHPSRLRRAGAVTIGAKTGDGRVTHNSIRVPFEIEPRGLR